MRPELRNVGLCAAMLLVGSSAIARTSPFDVAPAPDDAKTIRAELKQLVDDFNSARAAYSQAIREAKTDAERSAVAEELAIKPGQFSARGLALVSRARDTGAEYEVLASTLNLMPTEDELGKILDRLIEAHLDDPRAATLALKYMYGAEGKARELLDAMIEKSNSKEVKGSALLARASGAKWRANDDAAKLAAAEADYDRVVKEFAGVPFRNGDTVGDVASRALFEIRELAKGKPCPEIVGTDVDDVEFKLSDYKGKVVFLDFWGFW